MSLEFRLEGSQSSSMSHREREIVQMEGPMKETARRPWNF